MDEEEDKRKEQKENTGLTNKLRDIFRRGNNSKFKMIMTMIMSLPVGIQVGMVLIISALLVLLFAGFKEADEQGSNSISSIAVYDIINEKVDIVKTDDGRYYFKIGKEVVDEYLKKLNEAYLKGYYHDTSLRKDDEETEKEDDDKEEAEEEKEKEEYVYNEDTADIKESKIEDWFGTKDYKAYLVKMIRAEIASSYPLLSDYDGEEEKKDSQGNKQDKDDNYVAQGVVQIQRTKISENGESQEPITLKYLPYESEDPNELTFKSLVASGSEEALNYYSFEQEKIRYATYRKVVGGDDAGYKVSEGTPISYKSVANMCSMPYDFLFTLLQKSNNPEWIMKVVDLLLENSEVIIMLQDQLVVTTTTTTTAQMQRTTTTEETKVNVSPTGGDAEAWITTGTGGTSYGYVNQETTVITTYQNTVNSYIRKANTWCVDFKQEALPDNSSSSYENNPDRQTSDFTFGETSTSTNENGNTRTTSYTSLSERVITHVKTDTDNYKFKINVSTEKRINHEKFLGLWKNEKGKYELGALFDLDGKLVGYELPRDGIGYPPNDISELNNQRIDSLVSLLHLHDNTQFHEQLMMYYWNKYKDDDIYDVNVDNLLNLFTTNIMVNPTGGVRRN